MLTRATFYDNRTFTVGDRIAFFTSGGTEGTGTVLSFCEKGGFTSIKIEPDADTIYNGRVERWPLAKGGEFNRLRDHGIYGGEITGHVR